MEKDDERVCRGQTVSLSNALLYLQFKIFVQEVHGRWAVSVVFSVSVRFKLVCRNETLVERCHRNCSFL
jgi:hypothetical protein